MILVTGVAGFIGSNLAHRLLTDGYSVWGIDSLSDSYERNQKIANIRYLQDFGQFNFLELDLNQLNYHAWPEFEYVFHLAGETSVRKSWGQQFDAYLSNNVLATQRLLEYYKDKRYLKRFIFASSSSVYGNQTGTLPVCETANSRPYSPYAVSKLAAENLVNLYADNFGLPTVSLRYFTVFGPGQRPNMFIYQLIQAIAQEQTIQLFGNGNYWRDFTYIENIIEANLQALKTDKIHGEIFNIGSGQKINLLELVHCLETLLNQKADLHIIPAQFGESQETWSNIDKASKILNYQPQIDLAGHLQAQINWQLNGF